MPRFEYPAFIVVNADTRAEADRLAHELTDAFHASPEAAYVSLDDGEPTEEDEEEDE